MDADQSFEANLDDYLPQIRRIVQKISGKESVVDDISQECCVRVIEKEHLWRSDKGTMAKWVSAVTRNFTKTYLKNQKKILSLNMDIVEKSEDEKFSEEHISWVLNQFVLLPDRQKKVLQLKYFEGMKISEISKKLNVDHSTVSKQIQSALMKLKKSAKSQGWLTVLPPWDWLISSKVKQILSMALNKKIVVSSVILFTCAGIGLVSVNEIQDNQLSEIFVVKPTTIKSLDFDKVEISYSNQSHNEQKKHLNFDNEVIGKVNLKNQFTGIKQERYKTGELKKEIYFINDKKHGTEKHYYKSGKLWREIAYENGKQHGSHIGYNEDGSIMYATPYFNGIQSGSYDRFYPSGELKADQEWDQAKQFPNSMRGYFKNGNRKYEVPYILDPNQDLSDVSTNYTVHGTVKSYYLSGSLKAEADYDYGLFNLNQVRLYYENGILKSQINYKNMLNGSFDEPEKIEGELLGYESHYLESGQMRKLVKHNEDGSSIVIFDLQNNIDIRSQFPDAPN